MLVLVSLTAFIVKLKEKYSLKKQKTKVQRYAHLCVSVDTEPVTRRQ